MSSADHAVAFIVAEKDTGAFVKALIESPPGIEVLGYTRLMSWNDYMDLWSKTLGVRGRYQQMPREEFLTAVPEPMRRQYDEVFRYVAEFGWTGGDPKVVQPEDVSVLDINWDTLVTNANGVDLNSYLSKLKRPPSRNTSAVRIGQRFYSSSIAYINMNITAFVGDSYDATVFP